MTRWEQVLTTTAVEEMPEVLRWVLDHCQDDDIFAALKERPAIWNEIVAAGAVEERWP